MIVINLFGSPGAGKSTGAAYIFSQLKLKGINAELVTEYAKDKVWEETPEPFKNQAYLFGQQYYRITRCQDKVDVIVTDSPLLLSAFYNTSKTLGEPFNEMVLEVFQSYNNINLYVKRDKPYNPVGRLQTQSQSDAMAVEMVDMLKKYNVQYDEIY